jgi:hypothetical protein
MQNGGKGIEILLMNMVLEISFYKDKSKKTQFHASLFENGLNIF